MHKVKTDVKKFKIGDIAFVRNTDKLDRGMLQGIAREILLIKGNDVFISVSKAHSEYDRAGKYEPAHRFPDNISKKGWWIKADDLAVTDPHPESSSSDIYQVIDGKNLPWELQGISTDKISFVGKEINNNNDNLVCITIPGEWFGSIKQINWNVEKDRVKLLSKKNSNTKEIGASMNENSDKIVFTDNQIRIFKPIQKNIVELAKSAIRYGVTYVLRILGKSAKTIVHYLGVIDDVLKDHKDLADALVQWTIGFLAKNLKKIRDIPGLNEIDALALLEHPEIQAFGKYAQVDAEGDVLAEFSSQIVSFLKEKIAGMGDLSKRFTEMTSDPKNLARFMTDFNKSIKNELDEQMKMAELEAQAEVEAATTASVMPAAA